MKITWALYNDAYHQSAKGVQAWKRKAVMKPEGCNLLHRDGGAGREGVIIKGWGAVGDVVGEDAGRGLAGWGGGGGDKLVGC